MMHAFGYISKEERENMPKLSIKKIVRIAFYFKPFIIPLAFIFILQFISSAISLVPQIISKSIVDDALLGKNMKLLVLLLGASFGFEILNFGINKLHLIINESVRLKMTNNLKMQLFNKLVYMDYDFYKNENHANIKDRLSEDVLLVITSITNILPDIISSISIFITAFAAMGTVDWRLILAGLAVFPLEIFPKYFQKMHRINNYEQMRKMNIGDSSFVDDNLSVNGFLLMKLFTKEKYILSRYTKILQGKNDLEKTQHKEGVFFDLIILILKTINSLLVYFVAGYLIIIHKNNSITIGSITMTIALCARLTRPLSFFMDLRTELVRGLFSFERILDYLNKENKVVPPADGVKEKVCDGDIEFCNVDFSYTEDTPLLKNVNFNLPSGKCFALVGPSGAGKSSIINLLPRLYDATSGKITFDGMDIKNIDLEYLRSNIGVVNQDTYLFNDTILENLRYAKEDATQEEIEEACKNANIHDFIVSLPDKYETLVGNGGFKLSGGERQRLAIARVLLKNPKILILDEATSALDSINENAIQQALDRILVGRTSIIIAHRLSTVLKADKIMVLKDGEIVESGTHKDLVTKDGVYKELYETQFRKVLDLEKRE